MTYHASHLGHCFREAAIGGAWLAVWVDMETAASSAYWTAALRAREAARPDRLFADEFAADLAGERGRDLLWRKEQRQGREDVLLAVRTRWFDDAVLAAVPQRGTGDRTRRRAGHPA